MKKILIIDNIPTPYAIHRFNAIHKVLGDKLLVYFQAGGDLNRHWKQFPKIHFKYLILKDTPLRVMGKDVHTFHINGEIFQFLEKEKLHLQRVFIRGWDSVTYWYVALFCWINGIKYTLWSGSTMIERSWRRTLFYPVTRLIVAGADNYLAYGTRAAEYLTMLGADQNKIKVFYNSVDSDFFSAASKKLRGKRAQLRKRYHLPADAFVFLYIGQLIERKGLLDLLYAFSRFHRKYHDSVLLCIGSGPLEKVLVASGVFHVSHLEYRQVPTAYALADVVILPSHEEVWGLVINESLASGIPVIASTNVGAYPDLIEGSNFSRGFKAGDSQQLYRCMQDLYKSNKKSTALSLQMAVQKANAEKQAQHIFSRYA